MNLGIFRVTVTHLHPGKEMTVNHKKVQRVYRELGLSVKRTRRKHLRRTLQPRPVLIAPNQEWAIDFASDVTDAGQRFRVLGVIDGFTRQSQVLDTSTSFPQPACHARTGAGDRRARKATGDPL